MPTRNVNLTDHFDRFIEKRITSGRYSNASEVVREGLRLLELRELENKAKLKWLQNALAEATAEVDQGRYVTLASEDEVNRTVDQAWRKRRG